MFGDGHLASCKPISEADLASFMADCIEDKQKINQVLPIGGAHNPELFESVAYILSVLQPLLVAFGCSNCVFSFLYDHVL